MAYNPLTDFLALIRNGSGGAAVCEIPGLDYVISAMARAGMFRLSVSQTAPIVNQPTTVWLKSSLPSWVAEGNVFLWNAATLAYEPATPALWEALFVASAAGANTFQSTAVAVGIVAVSTTLFAIQRTNPAATAIALPPVADFAARALQIVDWSIGVVNHAITLTPDGAETIMQLGAFGLFSTADQLAGVTLYPSIDLNGWVIAP